MILGKLSGRHAFKERTVKLGFKLSEADMGKAFSRFKELADKKKYVFDEDIEALLEDEIGKIPETWKLEYLKVSSETGHKPSARLRLKYKNAVKEAEAEGDGPVDALYKALKRALVKFYPAVEKIRLTDYKVRVVDSRSGTAAKVRVFIEFRDESGTWTTVGVDKNIIEASWKALIEAVEYKLALETKLLNTE